MLARNDGDSIIASTGTHEVALFKSSFAKWPSGRVIGSMRDQLDAAAEQAAAKNKVALAAALVPGAEAKASTAARCLAR